MGARTASTDNGQMIGEPRCGADLPCRDQHIYRRARVVMDGEGSNEPPRTFVGREKAEMRKNTSVWGWEMGKADEHQKGKQGRWEGVKESQLTGSR